MNDCSVPPSVRPAAADPLPLELGPGLSWLVGWVNAVGLTPATSLIVGGCMVMSVALDALWHLLAGWPLSTRSLLIALLLPVPIAGLGVGLTLRLIVALDRALRRAETMALTDGLTGVRNRRWFMQQAGQEFVRARQQGRALAMVLIDVDHFKRINDEFGHQIGDQLLIAMARTCGETLRRTDLFARFGGEEFIVLLPETGPGDAMRLAERMRLAVQAERLHEALPASRRITISLGVAAMNAATPTLDHLIQVADQALYEAKRSGRDRVHTRPMTLRP
ncbi:MAG: hypothetical protein RLZZ592_2122 [Pseudomonadota bacterium]|jgi:diguanylate cyclase (GGDEF)-like protein|nr:hypothetical protein [Pseudomonadota bacterium]